MNRLSGLLVVCPSEVSENLVNFYFSRHWQKLRISEVILLKFFELKRKFEKCFGKTVSLTWAKPQQVRVRGKRLSEKSVGNFVKLGFSRETSKNTFVRRNILSLFFPNLKNKKMFREICISLYRKHEQIVMTFGSLSLKSVWKFGKFLLYGTIAKFAYIWRHYAQVLRTKQKVSKMFRQVRQFNFSKTATGLCERQSIV